MQADVSTTSAIFMGHNHTGEWIVVRNLEGRFFGSGPFVGVVCSSDVAHHKSHGTLVKSKSENQYTSSILTSGTVPIIEPVPAGLKYTLSVQCVASVLIQAHKSRYET